ncbi:MAG TPA: hypothetical protein VFG59_21215 [Anaeromyxobacter sp.]|nr:hypothetical protein [Anaeromyxobacter sp.]
MNRLAVLLAASWVGTGCVVHDTCDVHTVWVGWSSFVRATQTGYETSTACFSDFTQMQVYLDEDLANPSTANCTDNVAGFAGVLTGVHTIRVDGLSNGSSGVPSGVPLVRDVVSVDISDVCADQVVDTQPGESVVNLSYAVPGGVCVPGSVMWFKVEDGYTGETIAEQDETSPNPSDPNFACSTQTPVVSFILPGQSTFTLERLEEAVPGAGTPVQSGYCTATDFDTTTGVDTRVPAAGALPLADGVVCPL